MLLKFNTFLIERLSYSNTTIIIKADVTTANSAHIIFHFGGVGPHLR